MPVTDERGLESLSISKKADVALKMKRREVLAFGLEVQQGKYHLVEQFQREGDRGKALLRSRGELVERTFAHAYETGGMRRTHLRGHKNILKRLLVHTGGFNLGLAMRKLIGFGKPRRLQGLFAPIFGLLRAIWLALWVQTRRQMTTIGFPLRPVIQPSAA